MCGKLFCRISCILLEFSGLLSAEANKGGELLLSHLKPQGMLEKSGSVYLASNGSNIVSLRMRGQWSEKHVKSSTWREST